MKVISVNELSEWSRKAEASEGILVDLQNKNVCWQIFYFIKYIVAILLFICSIHILVRRRVLLLY